MLAYATTLAIIALGFARMSEHLPEHQSYQQAFLGRNRPFSHMSFAIPAYVLTSVAPMLWLLISPQSYFRHRMGLILGIRLMRLTVQLLTMLMPSVVAPLAQIVAARALQQPHKALAIVLAQPMAFYMQHALFLLPWKHAAVLQLVSTLAMLNWAWQFPCILQEAEHHASTPLWQGRAEVACSALQSYAGVLRTAVGAPLSELSVQMCRDSGSAIQVLQIFSATVCLLIAPVAVCHQLEQWMKQRCLQQQQPEPPSATAALAGMSSGDPNAASSSSGSSSSMLPIGNAGASSSRGSAVSIGNPSSSSSSRQQPLLQGRLSSSNGSGRVVRSIDSLSGAELESLTTAGLHGQGMFEVCAPCMHVLLLLLLMPMLWVVSEGLAEVFEAWRNCPAVLAAATAAAA